MMKKIFRLMTVVSVVVALAACGHNTPEEPNQGNDDPVTPGNQYEAVDLGLSVKWATCNVGANTPEEVGAYFAWGEKIEKKSYSWSNYQWGSATEEAPDFGMTRYNRTDMHVTLDATDDVATDLMKNGFRMPTFTEFEELMDPTNCEWEWVNHTDAAGISIPGYEVTSLVEGYEGKMIFLPAGGFYSGSNRTTFAVSGNYWTASIYNTVTDAQYAVLYDEYFGMVYGARHMGMTVRAVQDR
ncbi:MAG: hypothetical protein MJZ96_05960 [Paludibacteraceae bacterium]|nr:hypothetical protein [Paludibacteraceae bacterium]